MLKGLDPVLTIRQRINRLWTRILINDVLEKQRQISLVEDLRALRAWHDLAVKTLTGISTSSNPEGQMARATLSRLDTEWPNRKRDIST